jgi:hypothetical protein
MRRLFLAALCLVLISSTIVTTGFMSAPKAEAIGLGAASNSIQGVWERTDKPVNDGKIGRTWMWGPAGFDSRSEAYAESPGGQRQVFYFDKSRMEITNPNGDQNSQWFVTNGLLTKELVTGQMQVGDAQFETRAPADIPVAGDPDDTNGPTYATFGKLLAGVGPRSGGVSDTVDRAGNAGQNGSMAGYTDFAYFVQETGHNIPRVFWDFLGSSGSIYENGAFRQGKLFDPTFFATGYPISEAYWAQVKVGGQAKWVLMQAFERRVLTYTPSNSEGWKVEMGNIGRHYHDWRYSTVVQPPQPPADPFADVPASVSASATPKGGPVGTTFTISVWGFQPNEQVGFWINAPDGSIVGTRETAQISPSGRVDGLTFPTDSSYPTGIWSVVFQGVSSGHQSVAYFKITGAGTPAPVDNSFADVPDARSASIAPKGGPAGTVFDISIWGFTPNEQVGYWINTPDGAIYGTVETASIGPGGRIDHMGFETTRSIPPGIYSMVFHGVTSGHESVVFFKITG